MRSKMRFGPSLPLRRLAFCAQWTLGTVGLLDRQQTCVRSPEIPTEARWSGGLFWARQILDAYRTYSMFQRIGTGLNMVFAVLRGRIRLIPGYENESLSAFPSKSVRQHCSQTDRRRSAPSQRVDTG